VTMVNVAVERADNLRLRRVDGRERADRVGCADTDGFAHWRALTDGEGSVE